MSTAIIDPTFSHGEIAPSLFGRVDLEAFHKAVSTGRNMFVNYKGGMSSRAGTAFIGKCKQPATLDPPRDINFQYNINQSFMLEFGEQYMRVKTEGAYVTETHFDISAITNALPGVITAPNNNFVEGDDVYISGAVGLVTLNGNIFTVANVDSIAGTFTLLDIFGFPVSTIGLGTYIANGQVARIYTLTTPYVTADLRLLKYAQNENTMTLTHPNYPPKDLTRITDSLWTLTDVAFGSTISAPVNVSVSAGSTTTSNRVTYSYEITAVSQDRKQESTPSNYATVTNSVDMNLTNSSNTVTWDPVTGAKLYNVYRAPVVINGTTPVGSIYGLVGSTQGVQFIDTNLLPDFTITPPLHQNPFAPSQIIEAVVASGGTSYSAATTITVNSLLGSGAQLQPVIVGGVIKSVIINNGGQDYTTDDTVTVSDSTGSGAVVNLTLGPATGTYPSVVAYFQQRRVFANTLNQPNTYFMSRPGAYDNYDQSAISVDSDAIEGTPWAQQINGIQWLVPMPGGLIVLTGLGAWQVSGGQGNQPITPSSQNAQAQAYIGSDQYVQPITINYDILYVQSVGSVVRDLSYNLYVNIYTGADITVLSSHLFDNRTILYWAYAEEPYKLIWCVMNDGRIVVLTFLKEQNVIGWTRHDTLGYFSCVASCYETIQNTNGRLINAVYFITKRYINGQWLYYSERLDNRLWTDVESTWCVDCGLAYPMSNPNATLTASAAIGSHDIDEITVVVGGSGYTNPVPIIEDPTGSGAVLSANVTGGVITGITVVSGGSGYTSPKVIIQDPTGIGCYANASIGNKITVTADQPVFSADNVGQILRMDNGLGAITRFINQYSLEVDLIDPMTLTVPDDPAKTPIPATVGTWSLSTPTDTVTGLSHLEGQTVEVLADGAVIQGLVVTNGSLTLPVPASSILIGLAFLPQFQTMYADAGEQTIQGKRKNIPRATVRFAQSRGVSVGTNQIDASTIPGIPPVTWTNMKPVKQRGALVNAGRSIPLYTGDVLVTLPGEYVKPGQVAVEQPYPLPVNIIAVMPELVVGDDNG